MAIEGILRTGFEAQSSQTDAVKPLIFWESPHPLSIVRVNLEPQISQRLDELTLAAADPAQRRTRITPDRGLDQPFQRRRQAGLMGHGTFAPGTGAAHAPVNVGAGGLKLVNATI